MSFAPIPAILDELRGGRLIVLVDDEDRENEGDFVCAAEKVTPELINFMTRVGGGYMCVPLTGDVCERLDLTPQVATNNSIHGTPMTITVDGHPRHGVGTGVSAYDRHKTIQLLIDPRSGREDFVRPTEGADGSNRRVPSLSQIARRGAGHGDEQPQRGAEDEQRGASV